ncbi:dephospho-CoA kinase [Candidatus Peregrinibacteria bacterium CG11_big_fil_rev_8_21_14_0_20_46_8]|nr:MAG: dephospho-CoA kinase [Candidatus Peregrinibacteria bacterium CG11_big_fil_rev_8_21_14_0_20_46_8]
MRLRHSNSGRLILGVTGVIGAGKSTLCEYLEREHGFAWIHADKLVHDIYKRGQEGYEIIRREFGSEFVGEEEVDRARLRSLVLGDALQLRKLNAAMQPVITDLVHKKIVQLKEGGAGAQKSICIESFYFDEGQMGQFVDSILLVDAPTKVIKARLLAKAGNERNIPEAELDKLILIQRLNLPKADYVIDNNATLSDFFAKIQDVLE